jgi:hypothetical protein
MVRQLFASALARVLAREHGPDRDRSDEPARRRDRQRAGRRGRRRRVRDLDVRRKDAGDSLFIMLDIIC